jgi:hypothetical protein
MREAQQGRRALRCRNQAHSVPRLWLKFQQGMFEKIEPHKLDRLLRIPVVRRIVRRKVLKEKLDPR